MSGKRFSGLHHIAFATKNIEATYNFYHERLGMPLVHSENHRQGKGYFKHFFFDMGAGQYLAFFEIHNVGEREDYRTDLNGAAGMPPWVTHIAFQMESEEAYQAVLTRCKSNGIRLAAEVDHGWCKSLYFADPNGLTLELTYVTDPEGFRQDPKDAYDLLFQKPEDIGEETRKTKIKRDLGS